MTAQSGRAQLDLAPGGLRLLALLALSVVLVGCSAAPSVEANVARVHEQPFGDSTVQVAVDVLAGSGVATFDNADADQPLKAVTEPASPLVLMRDQVRAMALEANAGGGIPGDEIDALVEIDETLAPPSYILAGYVAEAETDGAQFARQLMGEQDWSQAPLVVFPQLVLVLFTADVLRERMAEADAVGNQGAPWAAGPRADGPRAAGPRADGRVPPGRVPPVRDWPWRTSSCRCPTTGPASARAPARQSRTSSTTHCVASSTRFAWVNRAASAASSPRSGTSSSTRSRR